MLRAASRRRSRRAWRDYDAVLNLDDSVYGPDSLVLAAEGAESLLAVSDFFSLNCPSIPDTRGFLDATRIARLPEHAAVVNVSRGDLVDDDALIAAFSAGRLTGAGLDVLDNEPAIDPRYQALDKVFLLPHVGSATHETRNAMGFLVLDGFNAFFAGSEVPGRVA